MPGIHGANGTSQCVQSETPVQSESMDESAGQSSSNIENDEQQSQPREIDQTDKINKFLLKSFLQHINSHPINQPSESVEENPDESDGDWEWTNEENIQFPYQMKYSIRIALHFKYILFKIKSLNF